MQHEYGQIGVPKHMVRDPAQDHLDHPIVSVGAHDEAVGTDLVRCTQEPNADAIPTPIREQRLGRYAMRIE
jgi:hypothetical protein